jgi:LysM repeat protein
MKTLRCALSFLFCLILTSCNLGSNTLPNATVEVIAITATPQVRLSCSRLVDTALAAVGDACGEIGRNQACYGNRLVDAEFQATAAGNFDATGDTANLLDLHTISTAPLDESAQTWGIVILKAQANIPDTLPGQNVTFVLFGDTSIDNTSPDMQAVTFQTGIGQSACTDAPPNAMLLQSPEGQQVSININGATLTLGSTLYITANENGEMVVATLEGAGIVAAFGEARVIQPGAQTRLPLGGNDGLQVIGAPSEPEPFDIINIQHAPLTLLPEIITLPAPISLPGGVTVTSPPSQQSIVTRTPSACVPRTDWSGTYAVQRGDTLSAIARRYNLGLQELQDGNCITDANLISVGQVLQVPQTNTVVPSINSSVVFTADSNSVNFGECTTVRWNVSGASNVYFADESVSLQGSQEVCPSQSTNYTLLVVDASGNQTPYTVSVNVVQATEESLLCPNQICDSGENAQTCPADCTGAAGSTCGNQVCEPNSGEDSKSCPRDCG